VLACTTRVPARGAEGVRARAAEAHDRWGQDSWARMKGPEQTNVRSRGLT